MLAIMLTLFIFLVILTVLVLIHELGHFLVARRFGIKVEEFGFGLPPRALGKKIGETIFSLNWLPIGGFVKLYGEDEAGGGKITTARRITGTHIPDFKRAFFSKTPFQRAAVVVAGVVMNAVLAVAIFYAFLFISGFKTELPLFLNHNFFFVNQENKTEIIITGVSEGSPADKAGIKPLARLISINGKSMRETQSLIKIIDENKGKSVLIVWQDLQTNKVMQKEVSPRVSPPKQEGALGIGFAAVATAVLHYENPLQKVFSGFIHPANLVVYNGKVMGSLIAISIREKTAEPVGQGVAGPVGIYSLVGNIVQIPDLKERILQILNLAGILSISLAFFNILPIPAMDGGRLFFILFELVTQRKVHPKFESLAHAIGMAILLTLILLITLRDLGRIFPNLF